MRIEGFVSLIGCVMFLFVLSVGLAALTREVGTMIPSSDATASSSSSAETSVAQAKPQRERRRSR